MADVVLPEGRQAVVLPEGRQAVVLPEGRQAVLATRLKALRRRARFTVDARTLLVVGSVLLPLGVVLVVLGWYGASHTTRVFEEIPYLISGGLLGIVLAVIGGFCYFGYWLARLLGTARELLDALLRIEDRLDRAGTIEVSPAATSRPAVLVTTFVATRAGSMYHLAGCSTVAGRAPSDLRAVTPDDDGLRPCSICLPAAH